MKAWRMLIVAQVLVLGVFGALSFQEARGQAEPPTGGSSEGGGVSLSDNNTWTGAQTFNETVTSGKTGRAFSAANGWLTGQATTIGQPAGSGISGLWIGIAAGSESFNNYALLYSGGLVINDQSADGQIYFRFDNTTKATLDDDGYFKLEAATLPTCASGTEGAIARDTAAGGTSGKRTKLCLCTSDGAGTPAYAWQNLATSTLGNTTTCGSE